ncbi:hypothetical protein D3C81_2142830 [compost metagenome]
MLHVDDGLVQAVVPGLLGGDAVAFVEQAGLEHGQQRRVLLLFIANQQMQMGLGHSGDQFGALEGQAFVGQWLDHHQDAANGLHGQTLR